MPRRSLALVSVLLLVTAACSRPADSRPLLAVIPKGTTHEFWKAIHAGALKAARERDARIEWKAPVKEDDREGQIRVVEDFINRKVQGIVLAPLDDQALVAPVREAAQAKIPVVIIDSGLKSEQFVSYVATDNKKGGALAAAELGRLLGGKGRILVLRYQEGSASTELREAGFLEAMRREFPQVTILSDNQHGGATVDTAMQASENLLARFKDQADGIFTPNESTTTGMLRALQSLGLAGKVKFVGFDSGEKLVAALRAGEVHGLVLQDPFKMGYLGVRTLLDSLRGASIEKVYDTGASLATKANMETPEIRALLTPDLSELKRG